MIEYDHSTARYGIRCDDCGRDTTMLRSESQRGPDGALRERGWRIADTPPRHLCPACWKTRAYARPVQGAPR